MIKQKLAITTINPKFRGGNLRSLLAAVNHLKDAFDITVFFLEFDKTVSWSLTNFNFCSKILPSSFNGIECVEVGVSWPWIEPWHYTSQPWQQLFQNYDYFLTVSPTAIAAHPFVLANKPFSLWIATPFWQDRQHRIAQAGKKEKLFSLLFKSSMEKLETIILNKATKIFVMSQYAKNQLSLKLESHDKELIVLNYPVEKHLSVSKNYSTKIVVSIARFDDPRKNFKMLYQAWEEVKKVHSDAALVLIGESGNVINQHWPNEPTVWYIPNASEKEKFFWLEKASLFIISSWQEGLCIAGLEAMSLATPVISTKCGGPQDFVIPDLTGVLVELNDYKNLAKEIICLLNNPTLLESLGRSSKDFIEKRYSNQSLSCFC